MLGYTYACASNNFNLFEVELAYNTTVFNNDNVFSLELSDSNGSFSNPIVVKTISNQNSSFKFKTNFQLPTNIYGTDYKLRVTSTSPEKVSPASDSFEAYYITSEQLILNNYTDVILCDGASKELKLNIQTAPKYQWYKDGVKFFFGGPNLTVTEPGLYYSEIYYGSCVAAVVSNIVEVTKFPKVDASLKGNLIVEICANDSYTLEATENNPNFKYSWYKDNQKISSLPEYSPTFTVSGNDSFGIYYLEIENSNGCIGTSDEVEVKQVATNFDITAISDTTSFILEGETKLLKLEHTAVNANITWFKDGVEISNSNKNELEIIEKGTYFAEITSAGTSCSSTQKSPEFKINPITKFVPIITLATNYSVCESEKTTIEIDNVKVLDSEDNEYVLSEDDYQYVTFGWFLNGNLISGKTNKELLVNEYTNNGTYYLSVINGAVDNTSNELEVLLQIPQISITSSSANNIFCEGKNITLSSPLVTDFEYQWIKDGSFITNAKQPEIQIVASGTYQLKVEGFGCSTISEEIVINALDSSMLQIDASLTIVLNQGETKTITASGADSYLWLDENNSTITTNSSLTINAKGVYVLVAKIDNCEITKTITVSQMGVETVPNALTLNGDGLNDVWILSNQYAFQKDVEVEIYNTKGALVLRTKNYQNNWPSNVSVIKSQMFFYVIKNKDKLIKKGTISVLK